MENFNFSNATLNELVSTGVPVEGKLLSGSAFKLSLGIIDYEEKLIQQYKSILQPNFNGFCKRFNIPALFKDFAIIFEFRKPCELQIYNREMELEPILKNLIAKFGVVYFKNAYLDKIARSDGHKNKFRQLSFHKDRSDIQPTPYSCFTRDPFDEMHIPPRTSSTLFIPNITGFLQMIFEKQLVDPLEFKIFNHIEIYNEKNIRDFLGTTVFEVPWTAPAGTGEVSILDNRTLLHASYYRKTEDSYQIGVRYLK